MIQQRRLADVRATHQRDVAASLLRVSHRLASSCIERGACRDLLRVAPAAAIALRDDARSAMRHSTQNSRRVLIAGTRHHADTPAAADRRACDAFLQLRLAVPRHLRIDRVDVLVANSSARRARVASYAAILARLRPASLPACRRESTRDDGHRCCARRPPAAGTRPARSSRATRASDGFLTRLARINVSECSFASGNLRHSHCATTNPSAASPRNSSRSLFGSPGAAVRQRERQQPRVRRSGSPGVVRGCSNDSHSVGRHAITSSLT